MKKLVTAGLITMLFSVSASAVHIDGKYPVCITEDAFSRLQAIYKHQDQKAYDEIMSSECLHVTPGLPIERFVSQEWRNGAGVAQVQIYLKGRLYDLWTYTKNLKDDD
ncbi:hypothetical protein GA565_19885 [Rouxiella sp. S1S-2]|uniref:hypothetical protein n=1 Tax=Rouxiella sp. S1S-2 TaxID=2653856 RepID=UPI001264D2AB|nr:hypothetical protein [Rouxiella sp. S1S-2]KAB7898052.1 hypothetical protein GA565_19885 [Rouxiella sp. S1S-2]